MILKAAVCTIVPRSPFIAFVFQQSVGYKIEIKCGVMSASMKWRHLDHLQQLSRAKDPSTAMTQKEVCPREEIADPPGTNVFSIERHRFRCKISCIFVHSVVYNRRRRYLFGILGSSAVRSRGRQGGKPSFSCMRRSELSVQVRLHCSYKSYSQGYGEGVPMAPWQKPFVAR